MKFFFFMFKDLYRYIIINILTVITIIVDLTGPLHISDPRIVSCVRLEFGSVNNVVKCARVDDFQKKK
ncbi:hypothetical protein NQ314_020887 [Rhamnusium bicolor]|uniref:Uncharacterized protein n=1 Tax=Rhamnusium bicolor TaxID=1586634 RepID=A0AAV8WJ43_9CUCU|nr:hypothetical protein NQ314_020887 [Rhamnusium bicolor]